VSRRNVHADEGTDGERQLVCIALRVRRARDEEAQREQRRAETTVLHNWLPPCDSITTKMGEPCDIYDCTIVLLGGPSPTDRFVNRHEGSRCRRVAHRQLVLRIEQCSLRIEHLQEIGETSLEPLLRQLRRA